MDTLFASILLGHLTGDYLLQSKHQALNKAAPGVKGALQCLTHCLIYSLSVATFMTDFSPLLLVLIFASHFPIDRWSLAGTWLKLIHGRTFESAATAPEPLRQFDVAFTCIVYTVVDNTLHLILLWLIVKLL